MKILLKTLGVLFSALISGLVSIIFLWAACGCDANYTIKLLTHLNYETGVAILLCILLGVMLAFCPVWHAINEKIDDSLF